METPLGCPFCLSRDIRLLTNPDADLCAYRCHDCERMFYATDARQTLPRARPPQGLRNHKRSRKTG
jgi:transposase-like protein